MSTPMERLLAELIPDGTFGGARTAETEPDTTDAIARRARLLVTEVDAFEAAQRERPGPKEAA